MLTTTAAVTARELLRLHFGVDGPSSPVVRLAHVGRAALPHLVAALEMHRGVEIGTWKGEFAAELCQANTQLHLSCVDAWAPYPDYLEKKNSARKLSEAYQVARARLAPYRCDLIRESSQTAVRRFPDASLDFVYIDGNHRYDAVMRDLELWVPKVKSGGIISGHDYATKPGRHIEVEQAVQDYAARHPVAPIYLLTDDPLPSFLWVQA